MGYLQNDLQRIGSMGNVGRHAYPYLLGQTRLVRRLGLCRFVLGVSAMPYRPRRASKWWLFGAPEYILDCFKGDHTYWVLFGGTLLDPHLLKDRKVHMLEVNRMPTHLVRGEHVG